MNTKLLGITINRSVVILRPKQPVLDWIRAVDPNHPTETDLTELQKDCDAFLIPDESIMDHEDAVRFIEKRWRQLFDHMLEEWILDESLWPNPRTLKLFRQWFEPIFCPMAWDLVGTPLEIQDWDGDSEDEELAWLH